MRLKWLVWVIGGLVLCLMVLLLRGKNQLKEPVLLPAAFPKVDCGAHCRMITTRLNFTAVQPYEFHFAGRHMVSRAVSPSPQMANYVDLDTGNEYDAVAVPPEPKIESAWVQTLMGENCLTKQFNVEDQSKRRSYIYEICMHRKEPRLLAFAEGEKDDALITLGQIASDDRYLVFGQANQLFVLDTADNSRHPIADSLYYVTNVSVVSPYIVFPKADGEIHLIDVRNWSDTNVSNDPALQYMAASDGKRIVWVDYRYFSDHSVPEVVVYDIASKKMTRVTSSEKKPSNKFHPTVEGDWIAWSDDRDSAAPGAPIDTPRDRLDVYGYNLVTKKEYHLVGNEAGEIKHFYPILPRLHRGRLYVVGRSPKNRQLFEFTLPADK